MEVLFLFLRGDILFGSQFEKFQCIMGEKAQQEQFEEMFQFGSQFEKVQCITEEKAQCITEEKAQQQEWFVPGTVGTQSSQLYVRIQKTEKSGQKQGRATYKGYPQKFPFSSQVTF